MANPQNLEPHKWKPGQSGNPEGRKPGSKSFKKILDELLSMKVKNTKILEANEIVEMYPNGVVTYKEALMVRMIAKALVDPDSRSAELILNRLEGTPKRTGEDNLSDPTAKITIQKDGKNISLKVKSTNPTSDNENTRTETNERDQ